MENVIASFLRNILYFTRRESLEEERIFGQLFQEIVRNNLFEFGLSRNFSPLTLLDCARASKQFSN